MTKVVVGSGWWGTNEIRNRLKDLTRHPSFFPLWYYFANKYIRPDLFVVVDACGPARPDFAAFDRLTVLKLDRNYGTPADLRDGRIDTKYCGWTRTVFLSAAHAIACDADVFVYVEQDCLVFGDDLLAAATGDEPGPVWLGRSPGVGNALDGSGNLVELARMAQNSLIVARGPGIQILFNALLDNVVSDGLHPVEGRMTRNLGDRLSYLQIPFGRARPLDLDKPHFYAQDWLATELAAFVALERRQGGEPPVPDVLSR